MPGLNDRRSFQGWVLHSSKPLPECQHHCLSLPAAEVRYVNMTALTRGRMLSSFWVVDRKHIYIGSAGMNLKAFSKLKELGIVVYDCSCLALDLHRIFSFYWQLQYRDYVPSIWSKRVTAVYSRDEPLQLSLNNTDASAYVSRFYRGKELMGGFQHRINENKFVVTDNAVYIGNLDWAGSEFANNAGAGLVIQESENHQEGRESIVEQLTAAFERDWFSPYTISLQAASTALQECQNLKQKLRDLKRKPE
ncbi:hypothetical protein DNTS_003527 [Danionella cerebrum]|uniref:PLD phosphodiesterase domain-containing protein n=1 Tax=Danionella cerebrum TaxID=2873325 RepID=A0A553P5K6_9TELE|nr:hypothetical protein DNTS_003527 [Danionella translucida]